MKIIAFWDMAPCSLIKVDRRFRGAYCLHHQGDDGGNTRLHCDISQKDIIFRLVFVYSVICDDLSTVNVM
jgi:hypothetical protein